MTLWLVILIQLAVLLCCATGVSLWLRRRLTEVTQQVTELEQRLEFYASQHQQAQHDTEELRSGIIGVGQRVLQLDASLTELNQQVQQDLHQLSEQQTALQLSDPESKIYSRAMKMVKLGADLEEIMRECELPRAEAELLFNLHQQHKPV